MASHADRLEPRLFRRYFDDGLLDLFAGAGVVGIGIFWAFDLVALGAIVPAALVPLWVPLRRRLIEPRAGLVEFSNARSARNRRLGVGSAALGLVLLVLFATLYLVAAPRTDDVLTAAAPALPAALLALLSAFTGLALGLPRFLAYSGGLLFLGLGVALVNARPEVAMIGGGALMLLAGSVLLHRVMQLNVEDGDPT